MDELHYAPNLLVALLLGAMIGIERQWRQRLSVLRTNALVALGAASFTLFADLTGGDNSPTRVAAQVVSGIGFLGAGVIMRDGLQISGLNTAATLWCAAAVGVLAGAGHLPAATIVASFILLANVALRPLVSFINRQPQAHREHDQQYAITVICHPEQEALIRIRITEAVERIGMRLQRLESKDSENGERAKISALLQAHQRNDHQLENCVGRLTQEQGVTSVRWRIQETEL